MMRALSVLAALLYVVCGRNGSFFGRRTTEEATIHGERVK
jgi:hypothetical protein